MLHDPSLCVLCLCCTRQSGFFSSAPDFPELSHPSKQTQTRNKLHKTAWMWRGVDWEEGLGWELESLICLESTRHSLCPMMFIGWEEQEIAQQKGYLDQWKLKSEVVLCVWKGDLECGVHMVASPTLPRPPPSCDLSDSPHIPFSLHRGKRRTLVSFCTAVNKTL